MQVVTFNGVGQAWQDAGAPAADGPAAAPPAIDAPVVSADAPVAPDSGADAGTAPETAAGPPVSGDVPAVGGSDGCSCALGSRSRGNSAAVWLVSLALLAIARRRRDHRKTGRTGRG